MQLHLRPSHYRALSMLCSRDKDKRTRFIYAEPAGDSMVRTIATDGHALLCLKVQALHDLEDAVVVEPVDKKPSKGDMGFATATLVDLNAAHHPLSNWQEQIAKWMPKRGEEGTQALYDSSLMLRFSRAADLLGCRMGIHPRPSQAAVVTLSYGELSTDEVGMGMIMPLNRPVDDPFDLEEVWSNFDRFSK